MDQHAVQGPDGLRKDPNQSAAQSNGSRQSPPSNGVGHADFAKETFSIANGDGPKPSAPLINGSLQTGAEKEKARDDSATKQAQDRLPPELEHWAHTYVPMGKLLERVAQQCYSDLTETVDSLADMPVQQTTPAVNGAGTHLGLSAAPDSSVASVEKKLRLMNFAQEHKDRFIKALVLSDWARNMGEMDKLIELRMWLQQQDDAASAVTDAIIRLKHNMIAAKMPNPNIRGAFEVLSTGKAPWMPDLGFIPPKPLTARQLLKTLKDMNFALSIRLNLHEDLPLHFRNYSIANGRATFVVPDEFEVDLAVADEDPQSPFYFIDLRFLITAPGTIDDKHVRLNIEAMVNEILANEGLKACYLYLHDFVLTYRTNLLRRQALEMARSKWSECVRIETIHRDFVVHYWTGQPGGKSWIHVGTLSGLQSRDGRKQVGRNPRLGIRWIREGQEISDPGTDVNNSQYSMEQILEDIIASHIRWRLGAIADRLRLLSGDNSGLYTEIDEGQHDSPACSLQMRFARSRVQLRLRISPVTGNFYISPANAITMDAEKKLNSDSSLDVPQLLSILHCKLLQDQIGKHARRLGWHPTAIGRQDDIRKIFGGDVTRWSIFTPKNWGTEWAVAVTISLNGEKWYVIQIADSTATRSITSAELLPLENTLLTVHRASLLDIEARSIAQISFSNITKQLRQRKVQYEIRQAQATATTRDSQALPNTAILCLNSNDLMQPKSSSLANTWKAWCHEILVLTHHGICEVSPEGRTMVTHVLKASLTPQAASSLAKVGGLHGDKDADISFSEHGTCALRLRTNFGEGLVALMEARLKRVERLNNYIRVAHHAKVQLTYTSISRLIFRYHSEPPLSAELQFSDESSSVVQLGLLDADEGKSAANLNPQRRVQPLLQKLLEPGDTGDSESSNVPEHKRFGVLLQVLECTLPLLRGFSAIEGNNSSTVSARCMAYAFNHYRLVYSEPFPQAVFDFVLRNKDGRHVWLVTAPRDKHAKNVEMMKALHGLWSDTGNGWAGLNTGVFAEISGVESLLDRLDATVREVRFKETEQTGGEKAAVVKHEVVILD